MHVKQLRRPAVGLCVLLAFLSFMQYHAPTNQFTISAADMKRASCLLRYAISKIRDGAKLDRKGYDSQNRETDWAEYSESGIIDAARAIGIQLGADRAGKLDVSNDG